MQAPHRPAAPAVRIKIETIRCCSVNLYKRDFLSVEAITETETPFYSFVEEKLHCWQGGAHGRSGQQQQQRAGEATLHVLVLNKLLT